MGIDDAISHEDLDMEPIERRQAPRAPVSAVFVRTVNQPEMVFPVNEMSSASLFITGDAITQFQKQSHYRVWIQKEPYHVECTVECVRIDDGKRQGVVLRLLRAEETARDFLKQILETRVSSRYLELFDDTTPGPAICE